MIKHKKILVTGGAGFIGSHLTDELVMLGYDVTVVDNLSTGKLKNVNKKAKFIKLNLGSSSVSRVLSPVLKNIDYVFHLATVPRIQYCMENPSGSHNSNVVGTLNLLDACAKNNKIKKIIHISSCMVYGDSGHLTVSEDAPKRPKTMYGVHKYMQEIYVGAYTQLFGLPSIMLRCFGVYGTKRHSESGSYPNVTAAFARDKRVKGEITIYGDGKQSRDFVHVFDVVRAAFMAMQSDFKNGEVFNIGTGHPVSINKIAEYYKCPVKYKEARSDDVRRCTANIKKSKKLLKWQPRISFAEGIKGYINDQSPL